MIKMDNCYQTRNFGGEGLPDFVNEILNLKPGKIFFGGSSLIHDLYFPDEEWKRDYDIWCHSSEFKLIKDYLQKSNYQNIATIENNYQDSNIKNIENYQVNQNILQIINVSQIKKIVDKIDFSFNTVFYDGIKLYFVKTSEEDIKNKIGEYLYQPHLECSCYCCQDTDKILNERINKYQSRGFTFKNFCPLCPPKKLLTLNHLMICVFKKMEIIYDVNLINLSINKDLIKSLNFLENQQEVKEYFQFLLKEHQENKYLYGFLVLFNNFFEPTNLEPSLVYFNQNYLELILLYIGKLGLTSLFQQFYQCYQSKYSSQKFEKKVLETICYENNVETAKYLSSLNPKISLKIQGDFIYSYEIKSLFQCFLENNKIEILINGIKNSQISNNQEECFICNKNKNDISLSCNHSFCGACLAEYYHLKELKKEKLQCPMCRSEVELSE